MMSGVCDDLLVGRVGRVGRYNSSMKKNIMSQVSYHIHHDSTRYEIGEGER